MPNATSVMSADTLLRIIRENQLVDATALAACIATLTPEQLGTAEAIALADALVEKRLLSRFQANLLIQGKSKSLRITSKYRLLDRLGAGGMGLVYLCEHIRMKRPVALKVLPNAQAKEPGNLERFHREAQAVAALKHPNIVQAYDVDSDNGIHYLVMEFIDGINLEKLVAAHGPLDPIRAAHYISQAADALQHASERNLVHRDIKPSNLLVDREGTLKVLDMGLARFFDSRRDDLTRKFDNGAVIGTADFMSPEQGLNSHDVDIRADIYSLGCTFYFLLAGNPPFHQGNVTQKLLMHQVRDPVPIEQIVPGIDRDLTAIVQRMMAKKPDDRFQTPGEVVDALEPWTAEPIGPPTEVPARSGIIARTSSGSTLTNQAVSSLRTSSRQKSRPHAPSIITERVAESAVRRMDNIPHDSDDSRDTRTRGIFIGFVSSLAVVAVVLAILRPWESRTTIIIKNYDDVEEFDPKKMAQIQPPVKAPVAPPAPGAIENSGIITLRLDAKSPRPAVRNGTIRARPTDLLIFTGPDLGKNRPVDSELVEALAAQYTGTVVPFALTQTDNAKVPNTFMQADADFGLHGLRVAEPDVLITRDFAGATTESIVNLRETAALPPGLTSVNAVIAWPVDIRADADGSTLRVMSGAMLFSSPAITRTATLGAGKTPLTLDFNGQTGFITLAGEQDYSKPAPGREYAIHARLTRFGSDGLVLSGTSGAILRLESPVNACPQLVVQGTTGVVKDRPFRVTFSDDAALGMPGSPVILNDAALAMTAQGPVTIFRPLQVTHLAQLSAGNSKGRLIWAGRISGERLVVNGLGQVVLSERDNNFAGLEIVGGTVVLQSANGTPAGVGPIVIGPGGMLVGGGHLPGDLTVRGGVLQPGGDDGQTLVVAGRVTLERTLVRTPKVNDKPATLRFRLTNPHRPAMLCTGGHPIDLSGTQLQFTLAPSFIPEKNDRCILIDNRSGSRAVNQFDDAPPFGVVRSSDGRWSARISYTASADRGTSAGGVDVMLYDFAAIAP